jgi:hypothetical protein
VSSHELKAAAVTDEAALNVIVTIGLATAVHSLRNSSLRSAVCARYSCISLFIELKNGSSISNVAVKGIKVI